MNLQRYLRHRRLWESLIVVSLVAIGFVANALVEVADLRRVGADYPAALPWVLEGTSHLGLIAGVVALLWWDARFPMRLRHWRRSALTLALATVVYALVHVGVMYGLRVVLFPVWIGEPYGWPNWFAEFRYEYLKDYRTCLNLIGTVYLYRFILMRLQGEAGLVDESDVPEAQASVADRFVVKKLGKEFLVRTNDIEWIESAGNYVNLHVAGKVFPLRDTMQRIGERLASRGFIRVHRGAIVNLDRVAELVIHDAGDGALRLTTEAVVPVSRRYRQALREHMAG
ncbi:MAG: LytTR family DNA-binding domain-containing protein [Pseudomonadota bacterium]